MWHAVGPMSRPSAVLLCLLLGLLLAGTAAAKPQATAVRFGQHPDKVRFVLELSEAPAYRVFTLPDPYRVVIDLPELDWQLPKHPVEETVDVVESLRFGLFAPGTSRVVLDTTAPVAVRRVFVLEPSEGYPYRLVLDMTEVTRQAFLAEPNRQPITSDRPLPKPEPVTPRAAPEGDDSRRVVVVDPGHGGVDPGATGISGTYEKDLVFEYAKALKRELEATGHYQVMLTRNRDIFLRLRDRVSLAQRSDGDLFISLHANTHSSNRIRGASVYTLSENSSDAEAAALAAKENKADLIAGVDLNRQTEVVGQILIDLAQRETMNSSKHFANLLTKELGRSVRLLNNSHRFAGFAVLKSPNVPSVLVEIGYMSHPSEERRLRSPEHRRRMANAMHRAIERYFAWQEARNRP